jgi:hypothetical protein
MIKAVDNTIVNDDSNLESKCVYDVSLGCVFQNEARFLKEWIEYHKLIGIQHFVLVDDRSTDSYLDLLEPYIRSGDVELFSNPCPEELRGREWPKYQSAVHDKLVRRLRGVSRWLGLVDIDEFIVPTNTNSLVGFLRNYEDFGAVYIRWEPFGTSNVARIPDDELLTGSLYLKWKFIKGFNMFGKSIVKPHRVLRASVHRSELMPNFAYWDSNPEMQSETSEIRLFHYWTRDEDFLYNCKLPRTLTIKDWSKQIWYKGFTNWNKEDPRPDCFSTMFNDTPDYSMRRFERQLRARVFENYGMGSER